MHPSSIRRATWCASCTSSTATPTPRPRSGWKGPMKPGCKTRRRWGRKPAWPCRLRTQRPVKIAYGRQESFYGHVHRHPSRIWMRHGATRDGKLINVHAKLLVDGGAYTSTSPAVIGNATAFAAGPYAVPNARLEGTAVFTNNPPCGAMRGFGAVQACFAYEAQMDKLARAVNLHPIEVRLKNALKTGDVLPTGQRVTGAAPVRDLLSRCAALPMPP